jgi:hypothetical protein
MNEDVLRIAFRAAECEPQLARVCSRWRAIYLYENWVAFLNADWCTQWSGTCALASQFLADKTTVQLRTDTPQTCLLMRMLADELHPALPVKTLESAYRLVMDRAKMLQVDEVHWRTAARHACRAGNYHILELLSQEEDLELWFIIDEATTHRVHKDAAKCIAILLPQYYLATQKVIASQWIGRIASFEWWTVEERLRTLELVFPPGSRYDGSCNPISDLFKLAVLNGKLALARTTFDSMGQHRMNDHRCSCTSMLFAWCCDHNPELLWDLLEHAVSYDNLHFSIAEYALGFSSHLSNETTSKILRNISTNRSSRYEGMVVACRINDVEAVEMFLRYDSQQPIPAIYQRIFLVHAHRHTDGRLLAVLQNQISTTVIPDAPN